MERNTGLTRNLIVTALVAVLMAGFVLTYTWLAPAQAQMGDADDMGAAAPTVPAVKAYYDGEEISFMHTEASDPEIAELLTDMMGSPVLVVPQLAQVPDEALSKVYVFTNGIEGMGPLGFQPDVFDSAPGDDGYSPLRSLYLVTWNEESEARELTALDEVLQAEKSGEVTIERQDVVINEPFLTWPGGQR
jgi:hypothetical protein